MPVTCKGLCRHCRKKPITRARKLCVSCYFTPAILALYPVTSKYARRGLPDKIHAMPCETPTPHLPGSEEKIAALCRRAALGLALWHPQDAKIGDGHTRPRMPGRPAGHQHATAVSPASWSDNIYRKMIDNMIELVLPLPPKNLHPNARCHWAMKAKAVKKARAEAALVARSRRPKNPFDMCTIEPTFYMPRRMDGDGLNSSLKAYLDGLQDGRIVVNDSGITLLPPIQVTGKDAAGERKVVLRITEARYLPTGE